MMEDSSGKGFEAVWVQSKHPSGGKFYSNLVTGGEMIEKPVEFLIQEAIKKNQVGSEWFWVKHAEFGFVPVRKVKNDTYECDGFTFDLDISEIVAKISKLSHLSSLTPNLVHLPELNEPALLHCMRSRFHRKKHYTRIGNILVSVNPFSMIKEFYSTDMMNKYHSSTMNGDYHEPHVFQLAQNAYSSLMVNRESQSVIISGESGSGKTEATKFCLQYVTHVSRNLNGGDSTDSVLIKKIIAANPLLESFGNAKTVRNDNSSRFGKWIEIGFCQQGAIVSARIFNFLLEKSRVSHQLQGERNFHIFYQVVNGVSNSERDRLRLPPVASCDSLFELLPNVSTATEQASCFNATSTAAADLGMSEELFMQVLEIISGLLWLGNLKFIDDPQNPDVSSLPFNSRNEAALTNSCELLGLKPLELTQGLNHITRTMPDKQVIRSPLNAEKSNESVAAVTRAIYAHLFDFVMDEVNKSLEESKSSSNNNQPLLIGFLDIFGFEIFEHNSFEQICINFVNEKLQGIFNDVVFKAEHALYISEGIDFKPIEFYSNEEILLLIEGRSGIFDLLDETCFIPKGDDLMFRRKCIQKHGNHPNLKYRPQDIDIFSLSHYAGRVDYTVDQFVAKNKDHLRQNLRHMLSQSEHNLLRSKLFPPHVDHRKSAETRKKTQLSKFRTDIEKLMRTISHTEKNFIRCIKSNNSKMAFTFASNEVFHQLHCGGIFEAVRIKKQGYPFRPTYEEFWKSNKSLRVLGKFKPKSQSLYELSLGLVAIVADIGIKQHVDLEFLPGKTSLFFKSRENLFLLGLRERVQTQAAMNVQAVIRRFLAQCWMAKISTAQKNLNEGLLERNIDKLKLALDVFHGKDSHRLVVKVSSHKFDKAQRMIQLLQKETLLIDELTSLQEQNIFSNFEKAKNTLNECLEFHLGEIRGEVKGMIESLHFAVLEAEDFQKAKMALIAATESCDKVLVSKLITKVKELQKSFLEIYGESKFCEHELLKAQTLLKALEEEDSMLSPVVDELNSYASKLQVSGLDKLVENLRAWCLGKNLTFRAEKILRFASIIVNLRQCLHSNDFDNVEESLEEIKREQLVGAMKTLGVSVSELSLYQQELNVHIIITELWKTILLSEVSYAFGDSPEYVKENRKDIEAHLAILEADLADSHQLSIPGSVAKVQEAFSVAEAVISTRRFLLDQEYSNIAELLSALDISVTNQKELHRHKTEARIQNFISELRATLIYTRICTNKAGFVVPEKLGELDLVTRSSIAGELDLLLSRVKESKLAELSTKLLDLTKFTEMISGLRTQLFLDIDEGRKTDSETIMTNLLSTRDFFFNTLSETSSSKFMDALDEEIHFLSKYTLGFINNMILNNCFLADDVAQQAIEGVQPNILASALAKCARNRRKVSLPRNAVAEGDMEIKSKVLHLLLGHVANHHWGEATEILGDEGLWALNGPTAGIFGLPSADYGDLNIPDSLKNQFGNVVKVLLEKKVEETLSTLLSRQKILLTSIHLEAGEKLMNELLRFMNQLSVLLKQQVLISNSEVLSNLLQSVDIYIRIAKVTLNNDWSKADSVCSTMQMEILESNAKILPDCLILSDCSRKAHELANYLFDSNLKSLLLTSLQFMRVSGSVDGIELNFDPKKVNEAINYSQDHENNIISAGTKELLNLTKQFKNLCIHVQGDYLDDLNEQFFKDILSHKCFSESFALSEFAQVDIEGCSSGIETLQHVSTSIKVVKAVKVDRELQDNLLKTLSSAALSGSLGMIDSTNLSVLALSKCVEEINRKSSGSNNFLLSIRTKKLVNSAKLLLGVRRTFINAARDPWEALRLHFQSLSEEEFSNILPEIETEVLLFRDEMNQQILRKKFLKALGRGRFRESTESIEVSRLKDLIESYKLSDCRIAYNQNLYRIASIVLEARTAVLETQSQTFSEELVLRIDEAVTLSSALKLPGTTEELQQFSKYIQQNVLSTKLRFTYEQSRVSKQRVSTLDEFDESMIEIAPLRKAIEEVESAFTAQSALLENNTTTLLVDCKTVLLLRETLLSKAKHIELPIETLQEPRIPVIREEFYILKALIIDHVVDANLQAAIITGAIVTDGNNLHVSSAKTKKLAQEVSLAEDVSQLSSKTQLLLKLSQMILRLRDNSMEMDAFQETAIVSQLLTNIRETLYEVSNEYEKLKSAISTEVRVCSLHVENKTFMENIVRNLVSFNKKRSLPQAIEQNAELSRLLAEEDSLMEIWPSTERVIESARFLEMIKAKVTELQSSFSPDGEAILTTIDDALSGRTQMYLEHIEDALKLVRVYLINLREHERLIGMVAELPHPIEAILELSPSVIKSIEDFVDDSSKQLPFYLPQFAQDLADTKILLRVLILVTQKPTLEDFSTSLSDILESRVIKSSLAIKQSLIQRVTSTIASLGFEYFAFDEIHRIIHSEELKSARSKLHNLQKICTYSSLGEIEYTTDCLNFIELKESMQNKKWKKAQGLCLKLLGHSEFKSVFEIESNLEEMIETINDSLAIELAEEHLILHSANAEKFSATISKLIDLKKLLDLMYSPSRLVQSVSEVVGLVLSLNRLLALHTADFPKVDEKTRKEITENSSKIEKILETFQVLSFPTLEESLRLTVQLIDDDLCLTLCRDALQEGLLGIVLVNDQLFIKQKHASELSVVISKLQKRGSLSDIAKSGLEILLSVRDLRKSFIDNDWDVLQSRLMGIRNLNVLPQEWQDKTQGLFEVLSPDFILMKNMRLLVLVKQRFQNALKNNMLSDFQVSRCLDSGFCNQLQAISDEMNKISHKDVEEAASWLKGVINMIIQLDVSLKKGEIETVSSLMKDLLRSKPTFTPQPEDTIATGSDRLFEVNVASNASIYALLEEDFNFLKADNDRERDNACQLRALKALENAFSSDEQYAILSSIKGLQASCEKENGISSNLRISCEALIRLCDIYLRTDGDAMKDMLALQELKLNLINTKSFEALEFHDDTKFSLTSKIIMKICGPEDQKVSFDLGRWHSAARKSIEWVLAAIQRRIIEGYVLESLQSGIPYIEKGFIQTDSIKIAHLEVALQKFNEQESLLYSESHGSVENLEVVKRSLLLVLNCRKALLNGSWMDVKELIADFKQRFGSAQTSGYHSTVSTQIQSLTNNLNIFVKTREVLENLQKAIATRNISDLEEACFMSDTLSLEDSNDLNVVVRVCCAKEFLSHLKSAIQDLNYAIKSADLEKLSNAIEASQANSFFPAEFDEAVTLRRKLISVVAESRKALEKVDVHKLRAIKVFCSEENIYSPLSNQIDEVLELPKAHLEKLRLTSAVASGDLDAIVSVSLAIKTRYFEDPRVSEFFQILDFPHLEAIKGQPCLFAKDLSQNSISQLNSIPLSNLATRCLSIIEGNFTEKEVELLVQVGERVEEIRDELYLQIIRLISLAEDEAVRSNAWKIFERFLQSFPPSEEFENYLELWMRNNMELSQESIIRFLTLLHTTLFLHGTL